MCRECDQCVCERGERVCERVTERRETRRERESVCVCVGERERECVCVCVRECVPEGWSSSLAPLLL